MATFTVSLVARTPQAAGPPLLVEVDRLVVASISYTDELNRNGAGTFACPVRSLSSAVKGRLRDLRATPCEVRVHADGAVAWAGELQTLGISGQAVSLNCSGLLGYTHRMGVTADLVYTGVDQFTIAKGLVDHWQGLAYGHYGLVTTGIGTSGVSRDRAYLRNELHPIGKRLAELGAVDSGFDIHVDSATRALVLSYPQRGANLSASMFLDHRNIDSASVMQSVAPGDVVSDVSLTSTYQNSASENLTLYAARSTAAVRSSYGRSWDAVSLDGVSELATLNGHGDAFLAPRSQQLLQPGVTVLFRNGVAPGSIRPGDLVSYSYDAGLGLQSGVYRVAKVTIKVDESGSQRMELEFV